LFDLISQSMLFLLESLKNIVGDYGWAIIALTVLVRLALWPVSRSQIRSMKMMQELQPKMKLLQERHKGDPQKLQAEMFKLYKDYKFNPLGGCLPMLIQLPIFIGLYWAIFNPNFMTSGDPLFLNMIHLKHTGIISHGGLSDDGQLHLAEGGGGGLFGVGKDKIAAGKIITVTLKTGKTMHLDVKSPEKALTISPQEPRAGIPVTISTDFKTLGLDGYEGYVKTVELPVENMGTKETEKVTFIPKDTSTQLSTTLDTVPGKNTLHADVLVLVIIFAATMILSQRMMSSQTASTASDQQQQMMKYMPIMFSVFLFIFPIPAGVLLYMDTNSLFQIFQTWVFQRGDAKSDPSKNPPSQAILDIKPDKPKQA
jgi:YidC/Oxa1 family membrane protein insertase